MVEVFQGAREQRQKKRGTFSEFLTLSSFWPFQFHELQGLFHVTADLAGFLGPREQTLSYISSEETAKVKRSGKSLEFTECRRGPVI